MKAHRLIWSVSLVAICVLSFTGCQPGNRNAAKESKITGSPSDAPISIEPKWTAGQRYIMRMESRQSYELPNFGGRGARPATTNNAPLESTFAQEYSLQVTNAGEGQRGIEMEILAVELMAARGEQEFVNYDSRNKVARTGGAMTDLFDQFVGGKIYYLVGADNKVVKVEGLSDLFARVEPTADAADPNAGARRGQGFGGGGMLRNMYNEDVFKQLIDLSAIAPPSAVRIGETWTTSRDSGAPIIGQLTVTTTNTFRGWQEHDAKKCARVEFTGAVAMATSTNANPMAAFMRVEDGTVKGHSWFAPEIGLPIETVVEQKMTISVVNIGGQSRRTNNVANPGGTNAPARIAVPVHQNISIKLIEVKSI